MRFLLNKARQLYFLFQSTLSVSLWEMKRKTLKGKVIEHFTYNQLQLLNLFVYFYIKEIPWRERIWI